eukprot:g8971.t1
MDPIPETPNAPEKRNSLMLKKKSEELSRVFTEIISRPSSISRKKSEHQEQHSDDESTLSKAEKRKKKDSIKLRGYQKVPRLGVDPEHDRLEKRLLKLATKGVVQMFNTVSKINKQDKIDRKEAVPKTTSKTKNDEDGNQTNDDNSWAVLQDSYLEETGFTSDSEDWDDTSNSVDLDGSIELDELSD